MHVNVKNIINKIMKRIYKVRAKLDKYEKMINTSQHPTYQKSWPAMLTGNSIMKTEHGQKKLKI